MCAYTTLQTTTC